LSAGLGLILRKRIPVTGEGDFQSQDIAAATELVASGALLGEVEKLIGGLA
jgi:hypothetical protein